MGRVFFVPDSHNKMVDDIRPERVSSAHNEWIELSREILEKKRDAATKGQWRPTSEISDDHKALHPFGGQYCPALQEMSNIGYVLKWPQNAILRRKGPRAWTIETYGQEPFYKYHGMTSFPESGLADVLSVALGWVIVTPPGWSTLVKNVPNNLRGYESGITFAEGSVRTDRATIRLQVHAFIQPNAPKKIVIERGQPMCLVMPFLRERLEMTLLDDEESREMVAVQATRDQNTFVQSPGRYRELFIDQDNPNPLYEKLSARVPEESSAEPEEAEETEDSDE